MMVKPKKMPNKIVKPEPEEVPEQEFVVEEAPEEETEKEEEEW